MSTFVDLSLDDNVPATLTFEPTSKELGIALWQTQESIYSARKSVTLSVKLPKAGSQVARVRGKLNLPVMDTVDTSLKIGDVLCNFEFVLPVKSTVAQRADVRALMLSLIGTSELYDAIVSFQGIN